MRAKQSFGQLKILIPFVLGVISFITFVGYNTLITSNIIWLDNGDPAQNYLAWAFFQKSPWSLPIGLNPNFGLDISNSIVYAGGLPIVSVIFKFFAPLFSKPFQYVGIWLLFCFITQAFMAWALISLISKRISIHVLGVIILLAAPPLLFRIGLHNDLACHGLVLAALYLLIKKDTASTQFKWVFLASVGASIHLYFLVIILIIWVIDLAFKHRPFNFERARKLFFVVFAMLGTLLFLFWFYGYFEVTGSSISAVGFGIYRMNLLSPINPMGWSYVLNDLYKNPNIGDYEGFNYLGLGLIFLVFINLKNLIFNFQKISKKLLSFYTPVLIMILIMTCLSLSNNIGIGPYNFYIPLSAKFLDLMAPIRSTGRLFWPVWYCIAIGLIWATIHFYSEKKSLLLLIFATILQLVDTSAGWLPTYKKINASIGSKFHAPLIDKFWNEAAVKYKKLIKIPLRQPAQMFEINWDVLANFANENQMGTNSVLLSRYDGAKLDLAKFKIGAQITSGKYDADSLYIIDDDISNIVSQNLDASSDLFAKIDGFNVLAPGWLKCKSCPFPQNYTLITKNSAPPIENMQIGFGKDNVGVNFLIDIGASDKKGDTGWAYPETWGTWIVGNEAKLILPITVNAIENITLEFRSITPIGDINKAVKIYLNGEPMKLVSFEKRPDDYQIIIKVDRRLISQGYLEIKFEPLTRLSPKKAGLSDDDRRLSIGLARMTLK